MDVIFFFLKIYVYKNAVDKRSRGRRGETLLVANDRIIIKETYKQPLGAAPRDHL